MLTYFRREKKKSYLSANLSYLLSLHALDLKQLSLATGVPAATLARLKKDGSNPTLSSIEPLLDFFRVDMDSFLYEDLSSEKCQNKRKMGDLIPIPIYTLEDISVGRKKATVLKFIGAAGISGDDVFGISINGDSLLPAFQSNSIILIDPTLNPVEGDYVLCSLNTDEKDFPVFRQVFMDGNQYYFKHINPGFIEIKNYENYKIIGVVIKSIESYR